MYKRYEISRRGFIGGVVSVAAVPLLAGRSIASSNPVSSTVGSTVTSKGGRPRFLHAAAALSDGRILVCGGYNTKEAAQNRLGAMPMASAQLFDPRTGEWSDSAPLNVPRARHSAMPLQDGRIMVAGGFSRSPLDSVEIYDPVFDRWTNAAALPQPLCDHTACLVGDQMVLVGGPTGALVLSINVGSITRLQRP